MNLLDLPDEILNKISHMTRSAFICTLPYSESESRKISAVFFLTLRLIMHVAVRPDAALESRGPTQQALGLKRFNPCAMAVATSQPSQLA